MESISLEMTHTQVGVISVLWAILNFWAPVICLERVQLSISNLVRRLVKN